jgi:hypothetical protein
MSARRILIIALISVIAVVIGITPSALQFFAEREIIRLQQSGVRLHVEGISGFLVGVTAKQLESWIPVAVGGASTIPLQIRAEDVTISTGFRPFKLQLTTQAKAAIYGGIAEATITSRFSGPKIAGSASKIDLSLHPQLRALGIESGIIDVTFSNHPLDGIWSDEAAYWFSLDSLELLPPAWLQTMGGVSQVRNGRASIRATIKQDGRLTIQSSSFDCSLASGALEGTATVKPRGELDNLNAIIRVNLNRPDSDKIARWLPIITGSQIASDTTSFVCKLRSTGCGAAKSLPFGRGCISFSCGVS